MTTVVQHTHTNKLYCFGLGGALVHVCIVFVCVRGCECYVCSSLFCATNNNLVVALENLLVFFLFLLLVLVFDLATFQNISRNYGQTTARQLPYADHRVFGVFERIN